MQTTVLTPEQAIAEGYPSRPGTYTIDGRIVIVSTVTKNPDGSVTAQVGNGSFTIGRSEDGKKLTLLENKKR